MMQTTALSSNWKKLQQTLPTKPKDPPTVLGKRKAGPEHPRREKDSKQHIKKRQKAAITLLQSQNQAAGKGPGVRTQKSRGMGSLFSKPAETDSTTPEASALGDAALEDIPTSQRELARKPSSASLRSHKDTINSGIVGSVAAGKYVAIDCEMVGVGPAPYKASMLARVSMVNFHGEQVYDSFVAPKEEVMDYRTHVSGITAELLQDARSFEQIQADVASLFEGRILVGHAIRHDLNVLMLGHPKRDIRDTSKHKAFKELSNGRTPGLKRLAKEILGVDIQAGAHSSIEDARATMMLYKREKNNFEKENIRKFGIDRRQSGPQALEGEVNAAKKKSEAGKSKTSKKKKKKK